MFRFVLLLSCFAVVFAENEPSDEKIVGGSIASPGQFPYQVSLRVRRFGRHNCGGTIISNKFILTAAHCIYRYHSSDLTVVVGTNSLLYGGTEYSLESATYHIQYNPRTLVNDIALLKVQGEITFTSGVQPLPLMNGEIPAGNTFVLSGWGLTSWPGNALPSDLQYGYLISIDNDQCASTHSSGIITNNQICTLNGYGQGACSGDSGGPLVYNGKLAGVVSWGKPCATGYPDVFTKVTAYENWIRSNMI